MNLKLMSSILTVSFCNRKRIIKPLELVMSLITVLSDKSVATVTDLYLLFCQVH